MSVTVGFSQAPTALIVPAPASVVPAAEGRTDGAGDANLFAALLALLPTGDQPAPAPEVDAAAAPTLVLPPPSEPTTGAATEAPTPLPELAGLAKSEQGQALLKEFTDALKAAKSALDEGQPLDPALEKKLKQVVDAVAAWLSGQPQPAAPPIDTSKLTELATGSSILPAGAPADLPPVPAGAADAAPAPAPATDAAPDPAPAPNAAPDAAPPPALMQAQIVPDRLAGLGRALGDFAAQLEKAAPELARALSKLADRLSVGDVSDDALAQLGLSRTADSTSPELEQLVAALSGKATPRPAAPPASIAAPVLDPAKALAPDGAAAGDRTDGSRTEPREPAERASLRRAADPELDTTAKLDASAARPDDKADTEAKPATPVAAPARSGETPAPAADPIAAPAAAPVQATATAAATRAVHAAYAAPVQQLNLPQVAFEVVRQFEAGSSRFQIRLDPPELGRVDVKLDVDRNGTVNARLYVERPETLDLMMRDQRALQQALQQAGLDASKTSLEFSLRQNPFAGSGADTGGGNGGQPGFGPFGTPAADERAEPTPQTLYRGSASASGVNLFV